MKNNPILLLLLISLGVGLFYYNNSKPIVSPEKSIKTDKKTKKNALNFKIVKNETIISTKEIYGITCKPIEKIISSSISGEIAYINKGQFESGDLLVRLENNSLFKSLADNKREFKKRMSVFVEGINKDRKNMWEEYISTISPEKVLTAFPTDYNDDEKELLQKYNCFNLYNKLVDQEIEMESYFILAKKPGRLHTIFVEQGDHITNKDTIAITNYNIPLLVKSTVSKEKEKDIKSFKKVDYLNGNKKVGTGELFYHEKSSRKNNNKVYYTFQPNKDFRFKYGDSITLSLHKQENVPCFKLQKELLRVDSSIILFNKSKKKVKVIKSSNDFFYVHGLDNGDSIQLNKK